MNSLICKILIFLSFFILVFIFWPEFIFAQECQICNWSFSPPNPQTGQSVNITLEVGNCNFRFNFLSIYEYGDGTMQGPVVSCPTPRCTLNLGSHTYNQAGTYNLTVVSCSGGLWIWNCNNDGISSFLIRNCSGSVTVSEPGGVIDPHLRCGDGIIQLRDVQLQGIDEECDCGGLGTIPFNCTPARLNNRDCSSFPVDPSNPAAGNFTGGDLSCFPPGHPNQCTFDTSQCTTSATPPTRTPTGLYDNPLLAENIIVFILYVLMAIFYLSFGITLLMILVGSYFLIIGGADPIKREKGKKIIFWAAIGFTIVFLSRGILELFKVIFNVRD